jgi:tetratricopeptide (TPR) repeat protein
MNMRRNEPCFCGSGKRYKNCHGALGEGDVSQKSVAAAPAAGTDIFSFRSANSAQQFEQASQLHEQGRLERAQALYEAVLSEIPDHFDALFALGVLQAQRNNLAVAEGLLRQALRIDGDSEEANFNLAAVLCGLGNAEESLPYFEKTLALNPDSVDALNNRGVALLRLNRPSEALEDFKKAEVLTPDDPALLNNLGTCLNEVGDLEGAIACFDRILSVDAKHVGALVNKSDALTKLKRYAEALDCADNALLIAPNSIEALNNRGIALRGLGRFEEALSSYARALALKPDYADALNNHGIALQELKRHEEALASYARALALKPDLAGAHNNRGNALRELMRHEEALTSYERALALQPDYVDALYGRGNALHELMRFEEALASYERALALKPDYADALFGRGNVLRDLKRREEALASYERALAVKPGYVEVHWNEGLCRLQHGEFESGWRKYEWRWQVEQLAMAKPRLEKPEWRGRKLNGVLLAWGEQGLGDQILHLGMLPQLAAYATRLIVAVEPRLVPLVQRSFPEVEVVALPEAPSRKDFDRQVPLGSIGRYLRRSWEDFPRERPAYLQADSDRRRHLRDRLAGKRQFVCGLSWFSTNINVGRHKSIGLGDLRPMLSIPGVRFVDLQYGDTRDERAALQRETGIEVTHVESVDNLTDIDGVAALIDACDMVITVSNTTAHLAGALGKRVFVMLPFSQGKFWYWHEGRDDSPWYPSARLFRQPALGDWASVIDRVARELKGVVPAAH